MNARSNDHEFIPSLEKGLAVIELFGARSPELTLSQIARALNLTPGSARRVLLTLESLGYLACEENRFRLATRVLQLGFAYLSSQPLDKVARPVLMELSVALQANCSIALLDHTDVVYVARGTYRYVQRDHVTLGARFPAHACALGQVLLAALPENEVHKRYKDKELEAFTPNTVKDLPQLQVLLQQIRSQGYAINDQQTFVSLRAAAVPLQMDGHVVAALVASTFVGQVTVPTLVTQYVPALQAAAGQLAQLAALQVI